MQNTTTINIGDEIITLRFGAHAKTTLFHKLQEYPMMLDGDRATPMGIAWIMFASYCDNCMVHGKNPVHDYEYFYSFIENTLFTVTGQQIIYNMVDAINAGFAAIP